MSDRNSDFLIEDTGLIWPLAPETIARRVGSSRSRRDVVGQAVALGFIFVSFCPLGVRIALRPAFVTRRAIRHLETLIAGPEADRIALSCDGRLSSWEIVAGADAAITTIEQAVAEAQQPRPRALISRRGLPLERCRDLGGGRLLPLLQAWEQRLGHWDDELYGRMDEAGLLADTGMVIRPPRSERMFYHHWGAKFALYGKDWVRIAKGRDVLDQPNRELARSYERTVRHSIAAGAPWLTASDIVCRRFGGELVRLRYGHLILPWRTADGAALVSGTQVGRRTIVLERPAGAETTGP